MALSNIRRVPTLTAPSPATVTLVSTGATKIGDVYRIVRVCRIQVVMLPMVHAAASRHLITSTEFVYLIAAGLATVLVIVAKTLANVRKTTNGTRV